MAGSARVAQRDVPRRRTFQAFENRGFARLWLANCLLYSARWMQLTLLGWFVLELTDSPWLVALVGFFSSAPMLALGLVGGILADVMHRQRLLLITQGTNCLFSLLLTLALGTGVVQVWHIYLTILMSGAGWALDTPSRRSLVYDLLGLEGVTNAMALDSVGMNASRMLGPAVAGALIVLVGVSGGYAVITGCYATALFLLWSLPVSQGPRPGPRQQSLGRNLAEGFRYVRRHRTIMAIIYITIAMNLLLFPYVQMMPVIARDVLHVDAALMGALQAAEGVGALMGAVLIASAPHLQYHGRVFLGGSLLSLLALFVFSMSRWYLLSWPALLILGLGSSGFGAMQSTLVLLLAREQMRGRALGVLSLAIGAGPLGSLLIGAVASTIHPVFAVRMHALLGIIALAGILLLFPVIWDRTRVASGQVRRGSSTSGGG